MMAKSGKRMVARRKYRPERFLLELIGGGSTFCSEVSISESLSDIFGGDGDGGGVNMKKERKNERRGKKERQARELSLELEPAWYTAVMEGCQEASVCVTYMIL